MTICRYAQAFSPSDGGCKIRENLQRGCESMQTVGSASKPLQSMSLHRRHWSENGQPRLGHYFEHVRILSFKCLYVDTQIRCYVEDKNVRSEAKENLSFVDTLITQTYAHTTITPICSSVKLSCKKKHILLICQKGLLTPTWTLCTYIEDQIASLKEDHHRWSGKSTVLALSPKINTL